MGIKGLTSLLKKYAPNTTMSRCINYYKNSVIAIDVSILIYKFKYSASSEYSHINAFLNKCILYIKNGIFPIFVIDGKPPPEKSCVLYKRSRQRNKIETRVVELTQYLDILQKKNAPQAEIDAVSQQIKKLTKQIVIVTKETHIEIRDLLRYLGFIVIESNGEAEATCAYLQNKGVVDFTYSDDSDALVLGCKKVLRTDTSPNYFLEFDLDIALNCLELTYAQFVDLCILCGCDYCPTIHKMNCETSYLLIKKYGSIENILQNEKLDIPHNFNYEVARKMFKNDISFNIEDINSRHIPIPNIVTFTDFLIKRGFTRSYIRNYIKKFTLCVARFMPRKKYTNTNDFFETAQS